MKYLIVVVLSLLVCKQSMYAQAIDTAEGRQIFMTRCTSCHAINKEVVGPALRDVDKRHTALWIINFVHSSQTVIKSGDTAAIALFKSHNNTVMPDHPDLKSGQIENIIAFIKEQSSIAPLAKTKNSESFTKPYYNKKSLLSQIVYLNFDGNHLPVKPGDTLSWILVGLIVIILVVVLYLVVLTNQITDKYYETRKNKQ